MSHYRLLKADSADSQETWDADSPNQKAALLDFGQQLGVVLSLSCDAAPDYLMQFRTYDEVNFDNSKKVPVYLVKSEG